MQYDHILVRYGELSLKKSNRNQFIRKVNYHISKALQLYPGLSYESRGLRFYILLDQLQVTTKILDQIIDTLKKIPGIYSFSPVYKCQSNLDEIKNLALEVVKNQYQIDQTIKVSTNRGDKNFPLTSLEITKEVSRHLFKNIDNLQADVHHPTFILDLDVRLEGSFIFTQTFYGIGGLPAGILGKGLLMISGGIDSVVAGYMAIKKGIEIEAIHFASPPYTSDLSLQKVVDLLEELTVYTSGAKINLYVVPFTKLQETIYQYVRSDYAITVMRRMMYRIVEKGASKLKALAIINGESIGQVASQTLESINVINQVTNLPIIRPLATLDKQDIINIATDINTYPISIRPYEDCCTVFVPRHPQIKPQLEKVLKEEAKFDYQSLIDQCLEDTTKIVLEYGSKYQVVLKKAVL